MKVFLVQFDYNDGVYSTLAVFTTRDDAEKFLINKKFEYMSRHLKVKYRLVEDRMKSEFLDNVSDCAKILTKGGLTV